MGFIRNTEIGIRARAQAPARLTARWLVSTAAAHVRSDGHTTACGNSERKRHGAERA
jgi:hypothetical protein